MPTTEYLPYSGTHACADIDTTIEEVRAARGNESSLNARINADVSTLNTAIATKANSSDMTAALALKADSSTVTAALAEKADTADMTVALAAKANTSDVNTALSGKQDTLTTAQTNAVNSGITAAKVSELTADTEEIENARTASDGTEYQTLKAHLDATETGLTARIDDLDKTYTTGLNLLNPNTVKRNYILTTSGVETASQNAFCSDYISVLAGNVYKIDRAIGSQAYPTVCYYNSSKEFVSASDGQSTTFTIPSGCAYVRVNGSLTYISQSYFMHNNVTVRYDYKDVITGNNAVMYRLWSENNIFYYGGALHSKTYIYLITPDSVALQFTNSITVSGSGAYLYFNKATCTFFASNNSEISKDVFFVAFLKFHAFDASIMFSCLTCAYPAFSFDLIANKLYIDFKWYGYIFYNGQTYEIPRYYTQELNIGEFSMIAYDVDTGAFVSLQFSDVQYGKGKYIPICVRNYNEMIGNCCYELKPYKKSYETCLCYGDSLTWYDGHEFTWGEHQGETCVGYESYLRQYLRLAVTNVGVSGQTTPEICARLATDTAPSTAKYIIIMGGDNDDRLQITAGTVLPPGSTFDTTTVAGALQSAIETVLTNNPTCRIILMTEPMGWTYRNGAMERVDDVYPQTYRNVAAQYGLPLIDLWNMSGINELNRSTFMIDPISGNTNYIYHPYNNAWERIGKLIVEELKKL